ncbi:MAG: sulfatase-like hydrolase/transferase, partial [Planctomycetota bacterium]
KWHLGTYPGLRPRERGFDEFYGFLSGGHDYFPENLTLEDLSEVRQKWGWYRTKVLHNGVRVSTDEYLTDELSSAAVEFIDRDRDRPFFLYLAYNAPHTPMQATGEKLREFSYIENERRRTYAGMVSSMDDGIGRVLDALDRRRLAENTVVVFLSDNGGARNNASRNTPLRGFKSDPYEGGVRVPFAIRWPAGFPAAADYDRPVSSLDIAATIVAAAGPEASGALLPGKPLDGVDLRPFVRGLSDGRPHETLFWNWPNRGEIAGRSTDLKLVLRERGEDRRELFDLAGDPGESGNLATLRAFEDRLAELMEQIRAWESDMVPPAYPGLGSWNPGDRDG